MRIQTFNNGKGLIHGTDNKRIGCDVAGTFHIGENDIAITPEEESILPILFNGCTGEYRATFISQSGIVYYLGKVTIKGGRIVPPKQSEVDMMELRHRIDELEAQCEALRASIRDLSNVFDTNSLNFLIK